MAVLKEGHEAVEALESAAVKSSLLATKLHRPALPMRWVARPYLGRQLDEGLAFGRAATLVSAPAGFGKTSCISEWVQKLEGWVTAWLSLDAADDDPVRFFTYLLRALGEAAPGVGQEILDALEAGELPPAEVISTSVINGITERKERLLLILDDVHLIQDHLILGVLEKLLGNPAAGLHLVLITREDPPLPLARLRANNLLTEVRARDLRFSRDDTMRFLNEAMGLTLEETDIDLLEEKTEGWIVGLQLAALAMPQRRDGHGAGAVPAQASPSSFIASLSGSHRFILAYLTEQVLSRQDDEIRRFLLESSILERLSGAVCNAVTGRSDGAAMLERLFQANLFLIALDDEGQWYRYHHLFADLLRDLQSSCDGEETAELHRRASRWYADAGKGSSFVGEAMRHALAAGDYDLAVDLLEREAMALIMQGHAKTVHGWLEAMPAKWGTHSPRTDLAFAWMHLLRGSYSEATPHLERARAATETDAEAGEDAAALRAEWLVMQSLVRNMEGNRQESVALAEEAIVKAPAPESRVQSLAHWALASAWQAQGSDEQAREVYQVAIQYGRAASSPVPEIMSTMGLAQLAFERGELHLAVEIVTPLRRRLEVAGTPPPIAGVIYGIPAEVYYHWYELEEAREDCLRAFQLSTLGGYNSGRASCRVLLSRLAQVEGALEVAAREIEEAVGLVQGQVPDYIRQEVVAQQVRTQLARGERGAARLALQGEGFAFSPQLTCGNLLDGRGISHSAGLLYNSCLHYLLVEARATGEPKGLDDAVELAEMVIAGAPEKQAVAVALEALLLRAQMEEELGETEAAQEDIIEALQLGEPEGFITLFVEQGTAMAGRLAQMQQEDRLGTVAQDYIERILAAFRRAQLPAQGSRVEPAVHAVREVDVQRLVEPLTERELEVLQLMANGLKYREIAAKLFISLNTVRYHVKGIYGKLNVNKRTQAIARAQELDLL